MIASQILKMLTKCMNPARKICAERESVSQNVRPRLPHPLSVSVPICLSILLLYNTGKKYTLKKLKKKNKQIKKQQQTNSQPKVTFSVIRTTDDNETKQEN